jgi:amino acid transporter
VQGRNTDELTYTAQFGVYGSIYGVGMNLLVLAGQFWVALFPTHKADAKNFFSVFLSLAIFIVFYVAHKVWRRNWAFFIRAKDMDIDTGRKHFDMELLKQEIIYEKQSLSSKPLYYRLYTLLC